MAKPLLGRSAGANLVFEDNFDSLSLDSALNGSANWSWKWVGWNANTLESNGDDAWKAWANYDPGGAAQTPAELGLVLHEASSGTLKLYGRENPDSANYFGHPYIGGMISTEMSHWRTYGRFECRAKFFATKGQHWAMWLVQKNTDWPPEIDIVEVVNGAGSTNRLFMNEHGNPGALTYFGDTVEQSSLPAHVVMADADQWRDWHVYKLVWTASTIEWWIDDVKRMSTPNYINEDMYFIISPEIGGNWPGPTDGTTTWPAIAEIDYVRIYSS